MQCIRLPEDVVSLIIQKSDILTLLHWRLTCKANFTAVALALRVRFKNSVHPFVGHDIDTLSAAMRDNGAVVSGSVALHFFTDDAHWQPGDMDIYVPDRRFDTFVECVMSADRLGFRSQSDLPPSAEVALDHAVNGIKEVRSFRSRTGMKVDVIRSPVQNPVFPLQFYWTTLLMNMITPDGCLCGYPSRMMIREGVTRGSLLTPKEEVAAEKYRGRGFRVEKKDWWEVMDDPANWTLDYFGDVSALGLTFRLRVEDGVLSFPLIHTKRGWWVIKPFPARR